MCFVGKIHNGEIGEKLTFRKACGQMKTWVLFGPVTVGVLNPLNLYYSTRRFLHGRVGADNAAHFALGTFQIFFSPQHFFLFFN